MKSKFKKMELCKKTRFTFLFLVVLSIGVLVQFSNAQITPTPQGIEGFVYHLDAETQVFSGFPIIVKNLNTDEEILGYTGKGFPGRYSFVLNWAEGIPISVIARHPFNESVLTTTLDGSIRNANLFLDMNFPNVAPNITSVPVTEAISGYVYNYSLTSFDWNGDFITYDLLTSPEGMSISGNTISWTPNREHFGLNEVVVRASDGENYSLQSFFIEVFVEKDSPLIISEPVTRVIRNRVYEYEVLVLDDESENLIYEVFRGPRGMFFENNVLKFTMDDSHSGEYIVIIDVKDAYHLKARQIFVLSIQELSPRSRSNTINFINQTNNGEVNISILKNYELIEILRGRNEFFSIVADNPIKKIALNKDLTNDFNIEISKFIPSDEKMLTTNTRTYFYLSIKPSVVVESSIKILFSVKKEWLIKNGLNPEDVVLLKYINGSWTELPTRTYLNDFYKEIDALEEAVEKTVDKAVEELEEELEKIEKDSKEEETVKNTDIEKIEKIDEVVEEYFFEAESQGLSFFAISHKDYITEFPVQLEKNKIHSNFILTGEIIVPEVSTNKLSNKDLFILSNKISILFHNKKSGKDFVAEIKLLDNKLIYQVTIEGNMFDFVSANIYLYDEFHQLDDIYLMKNVQEQNLLLDELLIKEYLSKKRIFLLIKLMATVFIVLLLYFLVFRLKKLKRAL